MISLWKYWQSYSWKQIIRNCITASDLFIWSFAGVYERISGKEEKNALKTVIKAISLIELGKQVLEWRITTPMRRTQDIYRKKFPFSSNDLLARYMDGEYPELNTSEYFQFSYPKERYLFR